MRFTLNGAAVETASPPLSRLLDALREEFGLTGTKEGCGEGECGACTVLLDGHPVNSCLVPLVHVEGLDVVTVEGLTDARALLEAFVSEGAAQCGICTPGLLVTASTIPRDANEAAVRSQLAGHLCRCTGYGAILRAIDAARDAVPAPPSR